MSNQLQIESYRISIPVRDNRVSYTWTYDSKVRDLRLKSQGLMTQKSGTYDSKTRDLRHERAIVTTRKYYSYDPKYNFNGAKHRFFI